MRSAALARRQRRLRILAALAAVSVFGFVAAVAHEVWPQRAHVIANVSAVFTEPTPVGAMPVAAPLSERPVYRHSIVPGGAYSRAEVADAMRNDPVVAAHYKNIEVAQVHAKRIDVPRAVYVSYRVGTQVYWTKNRVQLQPGETVLTDGETEIRARCGNLVSDDAQQPVAADGPSPAVLDEAEPETGSSTIAGARDPEGALAHVPFLGPNGFSGATPEGFEAVPALPGGVSQPMWFNGGSGGTTPNLGLSTGTNGTSLVAPHGGSERNNSNGGGSNGGGSNGGGSNGGGSNGGGSNGGGSNGGGSNGGGGNDEPPKFIPPSTTGDPETTTGEAVTTTTGTTVTETTGDGDGDTHTVPEPGTLLLLGLGACGLASRAMRARRK